MSPQGNEVSSEGPAEGPVRVFDSMSDMQFAVCRAVMDGHGDASSEMQKIMRHPSQVQQALRMLALRLGCSSSLYGEQRTEIGRLTRAYVDSGGVERRTKTKGNGANGSEAAAQSRPKTTAVSAGKPAGADNVSPDAAAAANEGSTSTMKPDPKKLGETLAGLTPKLRQVAAVYAKHGPNKGKIISAVGVTDAVAGQYCSNLIKKLGLKGVKGAQERQRLVALAVENMPQASDSAKKPRASKKKATKRAKKKSRKTGKTSKAQAAKPRKSKQTKRAATREDLKGLARLLRKHAEQLGGGNLAMALTHVAYDLLPQLEKLRRVTDGEMIAALVSEALAELRKIIDNAEKALAKLR